MTLTVRTRWLLFLAAGLALYGLGTCNGRSGATEAVDQANALLATARVYHGHLARLQAISQAAIDSAHRYAQAAQARGRRIQALDSALIQASSVRDTVAVLQAQNAELRNQAAAAMDANVQLERARLAAVAQFNLAQARVDSLEARLRGVLAVAECRWDLVVAHPKCPSRTTTALLGAAAGAVIVVTVRH